jgi:hypothetical protein
MAAASKPMMTARFRIGASAVSRSTTLFI